MLTTKAFWAATAERAIKTFAQALLALLGTGSVGLTQLDWTQLLAVAGTAALASVLTSLASLSTIAKPAPADTPAGPDVVVNTPAAEPVAPAKTFAATQARIDALPADAITTTLV